MPKHSSKDSLEELIDCFRAVDDPRVQGRSKHLLIDIVVLSVCAILCGAEGILEIEEFGIQKEAWFKQYLELPHGIPSHDTIARVLSLVDPSAMEAAFFAWTQGIAAKKGLGRTLSLDGKSVAGTERRFSHRFEQLHLVSAYSHELGLSLAQAQAKNRGTGETSAVLECLDLLELKGVTVMMDAALSTRRVIEKIRGKKGHYLLPIKGNQRPSLEEIQAQFEKQKKKIQRSETEEKGHGREEHRGCELLPVTAMDLSDRFKESWAGVQTIFSICRKRKEPDPRPMLQKVDSQGVRQFEKNTNEWRESEETTYFVSSRKLTAEESLREARKHWGIENNLHWVLDVAFGEDDWSVRGKALSRSLSVLRKVALNLIRKSKTQGSVRARMKRAGWNNQFLEQLLFS